MSYPQSHKSPGASRHSSFPVARGAGGHELDEIRASRESASPSETRLQAAVVRTESSDPYADPPCTD